MESYTTSLPLGLPNQSTMNQMAHSTPASVSPAAQSHHVSNGTSASATSAKSDSVTPPLPSAHIPPPLAQGVSPSLQQGIWHSGQTVPQTQPPLSLPPIHTQLPSHPAPQQTQPPRVAQSPHHHAHHHQHNPGARPALNLTLPPPTQGVQGSTPPTNQSLPSPNQTIGREQSEEYQRLSSVFAASTANTVRQAVRDYWEKAILGSQYHIAFLLIATMQQADNDTLCRAVKDFGGKMIRASKEHVVRHLKTEDIDEVTDVLLAEASSTFLDKALARRLETIPARQLVNALARAERLGYDVQDIVEEEQGGGEHVIPSLHSLVVPSSAPLPAPAPVPSQPLSTQLPHHVASHPGTPMQSRSQNSSSPVSIDAGPAGVVYCDCGWPCSSKKALDYHQKKRACDKALETDHVGKELCAHCGCRFTSPGGLYYHGKVNVCGAYTPEQTQRITALVAAFRQGINQYSGRPRAYQTPSQTPMGVVHERPATQTTPIPVMRTGKTAAESEAYANLTPRQRQEFEREMANAEEFYGNLMRQAMAMPEPEKSKQLAALKNRYNTKQSVTRKKYGIRLRERRSRAEIEAERTRLFGTPDGPSLSGRDATSPAQKRARVGENGESVSAGRPEDGPANTPRKRVPLAEMGGLSGSSATAELHDPTASLVPSQTQWEQQNPQHQNHVNAVPGVTASGTQADPMSIDDESSGSGSDDDIPA